MKEHQRSSLVKGCRDEVMVREGYGKKEGLFS